MTEEGRYPQDFNLPKTVDQMKVLDSKPTPSPALVASPPDVLKGLCTRIPCCLLVNHSSAPITLPLC